MEFKDRVANKPNRVKLTYEDNNASVYATVELADEPIEEGTPLNALNMNKLLNKENNDYIVEQGTSGIWTYRKWNSGIAELWGKATNLNAGYDEVSSFNRLWLPISIYNPVANFTSLSWQIHSIWMVDLDIEDKSVFEFMATTHEPENNITDAVISIRIIGSWK